VFSIIGSSSQVHYPSRHQSSCRSLFRCAATYRSSQVNYPQLALETNVDPAKLSPWQALSLWICSVVGRVGGWSVFCADPTNPVWSSRSLDGLLWRWPAQISSSSLARIVCRKVSLWIGLGLHQSAPMFHLDPTRACTADPLLSVATEIKAISMGIVSATVLVTVVAADLRLRHWAFFRNILWQRCCSLWRLVYFFETQLLLCFIYL